MTLLALPLEVVRDILDIAVTLDAPYYVVRLRAVCRLFDVEIMRSLVRTKIEWQQWERSYRMPPEMTVKFLSHRMLEDGPLQSALTSTLNFIKEEQAREPSLGTQDYGRHLLDAVITHFSALPHLLKATYPAKEPSVTYTNRLRIDKASHNALVAVCSAGDIPFMRHLLNVYNYGPAACNTSPTLSSPFFGSPLHGAILGGHEEALTILRCYGADINTLYQRSLTDEGQNSQGFYRKSWSVLQDAANSGHASLVRLLLKSGVEPDLDDHAHRYRALLAAVRLGQSDVVDAFLEFGHHASEQIDADGLNMEQRILSHACRYGHVDIVRKMLDRGVDSNLEASRTTLYLAAGSGDIATMELLRQRGAILGRYGKRQRYRNELAAAAVNGNYRAVDLLVSWGIAVDDESMKFNMRAMIWEGNLIGVQCLISLGFDSSNLGGNYYLLSAVWAGREHAVEFFLKQGTDPNPPPSLLPHCNPLYAALESRHYRIARMLLAYGANRITLPRRFVDRNGVLNPVNWINHHVRNRCGCNCSFSEYSWAETPAWHHQRRELDDEVLALALACKVDAPVRCQHDPPQLNPPMIHKEHDAMEWVSFDDLPLDFMQE